MIEYPKWIIPASGDPYIINGPDEEPQKIKPEVPKEPPADAPKRRGRSPKVRADDNG